MTRAYGVCVRMCAQAHCRAHYLIAVFLHTHRVRGIATTFVLQGSDVEAQLRFLHNANIANNVADLKVCQMALCHNVVCLR